MQFSFTFMKYFLRDCAISVFYRPFRTTSCSASRRAYQSHQHIAAIDCADQLELISRDRIRPIPTASLQYLTSGLVVKAFTRSY